LLVLLYAKITQTETFSAVNRRIPIMAALAFGALILQIALGGWTSANYAALMCTSLPICQGDWASHLDLKTAFTLLQTGHDNYEFGVLDYSGRMTIHVSHRIGAIIVTGVLLTLCWMLYRSKNTLLQKESMLLVALLVVQLSLGVSNVLFHLPLSIAVLHNLGGALLLATIVRINYRLHAHAISKKKESQPSTLNLSLKPSIRRPHE
jgi:cytochrome c oxidase assembly protein subunit 15